MVTNDLLALLMVRLSDVDFQEQDAASQIRNKLNRVVETANITQLLIDVQDITFLSSSAIGQLIMLKKKCDREQIALALCNVSPEIMRVLQVVRADEVIELFEDQGAAIDSLGKTLMPPPNEPLSDEAIAEMHHRAASGDVEMMYELGRRISDGDGFKQDFPGAVAWYERAARKHHSQAQFELATCHAFGLGVPQDYCKAVPWYEQAAEQGHADAQYMMGLAFNYALNDIEDPRVARMWYELAAAQGHHKAKLALDELPCQPLPAD